MPTEATELHPWPVFLIAAALIGFALVGAISDHAIDLTTWRGWALVTLFLIACVSLRNIRRSRWQRLKLALVIASTLGLQVLSPGGEFSYMLYVILGVIGAATPARRLPYVAPITIVGLVALAFFQGTIVNIISFFSFAFTYTVTLFLAHTLVNLRKSREEQIRLYKELQQAHAELKAQAAQAEELATLHERTRLARDLHDTLGHALSTITVQLEAIRRTAGRHPEQLEPMLAEAQTLARQATRDLRQSLSDLRDAVPEKSFTEALSDLAQSFAAQHGWKLELSLKPVNLPPQLAQALLNVATEAFTNIARHARAHRVSVNLTRQEGEAVLTIADDGQGFAEAAPKAGHYGLQGMLERMNLLGGRLEINSKVGQGVSLTARLPLQALPEASLAGA